jgi:ABC-type antimicrobial peptide transport system permease subunit
MFEKFGFYLRHSINDLRVNGQRTFFALLCIAAGVAAIVSLQTLAVMISTTLTDNLQESNRGDIVIQTTFDFAEGGDEALQSGLNEGILEEQTSTFFGQTNTNYFVSMQGVERLQAWFDENYPGTVITPRQSLTDFIGTFLGGGTGTSITDPSTGNEMSQLSPIVINSERYPFYSQIVSQDGTLLADLLNEPNDIVVNEMVARDLGVEVGDVLRLNGSDSDFIVRGVVDTSQEVKNITGAIFALFGFYYLDQSALPLFPDANPQISEIYVRLADPEQLSTIDNAFRTNYPFLLTTTTDDLRENYEQISAGVSQLTTIMGLISMLIGAIGIVNTMQVVVRRRMLEIAVLKTVGLQANQVTTLFMVEAILMGIVGSLAGVVLGWAAVFLIRGAAETLVGAELPFMFAPGAAINGLIVGILVTAVFGFLPTLTAGQVRPGIVLRPNDNLIPRAGCLQTLLALVVIIVVLSLVAQTILGSFTTSVAVIIGVFIAAGVLYALLSLFIWLIGRFFPTLGVVDLRISLRQMLAGRSRAAVTLLALVVGVFSLSLITLLADSINNLMRYALDEASGGNVAIIMQNDRQIEDVEAVLSGLEGVNSYQTTRNFNLTLVGLQEGETRLDEEALRQRVNANWPASPFGGDGEDIEIEDGTSFDRLSFLESALESIDGRVLDQLPPDETVDRGRTLTPADAGQPVIVITENNAIRAAQIDVGDRLLYTTGEGRDAQEIAFEVVGIKAQGLISGGLNAMTYAPLDAFPSGVSPSTVQVVVDIDEAQISALRRQLADEARGAFVLETAVFTELITALLGTFTAFPTMVALLGLIVGGVVIANSVALTTMERRREIAIMKSVGLQRERVLFMILLENGILGLIGGLIGVGIGLVGLIISVSVSGIPTTTLPYGTALVLMLICVGVALVAALTTAWGASGEKPLNVLRYE